MKNRVVSFLKRWLSWRLIGPCAVTVAILLAGPQRVWSIVSGLDIWTMAAASAMAIPVALARGLRWSLLLKQSPSPLGFSDATAINAMSMTLAAVTPARAGELARVVAMNRRGTPFSIAMAYTVLDRLFDLSFILVAGYAALWSLSKHVGYIHIVAGGLLLLGLTLLAFRAVIGRLVLQLIPASKRPALLRLRDELTSALRGHRPTTIAAVVLLTAAGWGLQFSSVWLAGRALGLELPFLYVCAVACLVSLSGLLPITIAGAGTRDALFLVFFAPLGLAPAQCLAYAGTAMVLFLFYCIVFYATSVGLTALGNTRSSVVSLQNTDTPDAT
jgi:uncharacterized protein (TIRG00374 family)